MDKAQGEFRPLWQAGLLLEVSDNAALLNSPKIELRNEQNEEAEILAMLKEEEMIIEQDLNVKSSFLTDSESSADTLYSENLVNYFKTLEQTKSETFGNPPDLENQASGADVGVLSTPTLPRGVTFEPDKTFICNDCGRQFDKELQLIQHTISHNTTSNGRFNCPECDFRTPSRVQLERHLRIHDKSRQHKCDNCGRRFARGSHLNRHLRTHIGETRYSCPICAFNYCQRRQLEKHMRSHAEDNPFSVYKGGK